LTNLCLLIKLNDLFQQSNAVFYV